MAAPVHPLLIEGLTSCGYTCFMEEKITQEAAFELIRDSVGVITSTRLQLDKALIDAAPKLQWIGRMGSGMEVIDLEYAASKNITCFGSPEGNCNAVGEHALGMLLGLIRRIVWSNIEMKQGIWLREENRGIELEGKTVGIIGYGHTGEAFAKKLQGFDVNVMAYDMYAPSRIPHHIENCSSLEPVFQKADIVSFHVPFHADTTNYLDNDFVNRMHKPFILVNTSRGSVVNTNAVYQGLLSGKILGACLDVFEREPLSGFDKETTEIVDSIKKLPNVVTTPHIAGYTAEALFKMSKVLLTKILQTSSY